MDSRYWMSLAPNPTQRGDRYRTMTNDNAPPATWTCLDCAAGAQRLCRNGDGSHAFEQLAAAYLANSDDPAVSDLRHRAADCVREMVVGVPAAAVGFLVVACAQCTCAAELCLLAAGPLEDLLECHGGRVISELERIGRIDPRFRLMLSGTWGEERIDADVWQRLVRLVAAGPVLDADPRTPARGLTPKVAGAATLAALFSIDAPRSTRH
jgi:hypothetical protein